VEPREGTNRSSTPARASAANRRCAMRVVHDKDQGMVVVYELSPTVADSGPRSLVFETNGATSRVEQYPEFWRLLGDDELLALRTKQS
jgi:hypothetical protein